VTGGISVGTILFDAVIESCRVVGGRYCVVDVPCVVELVDIAVVVVVVVVIEE
jgi:hypothetical protein